MDKNKQDIATQISKWLNGELTEVEAEQLQQDPAFEDFREIVQVGEYLEAPSFDPAKSLQALKAKRPKQYSQRTRQRRMILRLAISAAAAIILIMSGLWWMSAEGGTSISTLASQQEEVTLPDGSLVRLNALSKLSFSTDSWATNREVQLSGEAFFEVEKGSTFTVLTKQGQVEVLGTSFNVYTRENTLETQCYEGKVRLSVAAANTEDKVLTKGKGWSWKEGEWRPLDINTAKDRPGWTSGESAYRDTPITRVFQDLGRQYDKEIVAEGLDGMLFTGYFVHNDLDKALTTICGPFGLNYEIQADGSIMISR
ncbi:MAG: FecR domain-containing protein [Bacteroidota bacterium]